MNQSKHSKYLPNNLQKAVYETLLRRLTPKESSDHLEDIVNALMDALLHGELYITLDPSYTPNDLKAKGWPESHREALARSGWSDGASSPIVLKGKEISWRRWHNNMEQAINDLLQRSSSKNNIGTRSVTRKIAPSQQNLNPEQRAATEAIFDHGVVLISGGPGTGKTSTVVRLLQNALYLNNHLKVGLSAPTGKATRRLKETIQKTLENLDPSQRNLLSNIPCNTLHSWLEARPSGFGRNKENPLPLDLLVIDEMSMVDLALTQGLLAALPKESQLVLVGDADQLPPIGSGAIWHQLQKETIRTKFGKGSIYLNKLYRNQGALASLSKILREKNLLSFWEELNKLSTEANVELHSFNKDHTPTLVLRHAKHHYDELKKLANSLSHELEDNNLISSTYSKETATLIDLLFSYLEKFIVLCPRRHGFWGVNHVHQAILGNDFEKDLAELPQGTPVMCGENQPELGLANGDVGILIREGNSRRIIFRVFSGEKNLSTRLIHPARLKTLEPALAMTIHKAQGSEMDHVLLLWPDFSNDQSITDEKVNNTKTYETRLLYTAITRAKEKLDLIVPI